jgi:selenocysteine lyase/cysteine desulfurase
MRLYDEFRIEVPLVRFAQPERRWFRVSTQIYNSIAQFEYLAQAIEAL